MAYICQNAVAMIIFNRPDKAKKVFEAVRQVKPPRLYIIADGARNESDIIGVNESRQIVDLIDWQCDCKMISSDYNLGCKKRVITGITEVFKYEEQAIILEDDCVPTETFFRFQDWGLEKFKDNENIAVVNGSNLLDNDFCEKEYLNGFSIYFNCWGWGTWKRVWDKYDAFLSIQEINRSYKSLFNKTRLSRSEKKYWLYIFRHTVYTRTIWSFYLQYLFFKYSWRSVYPTKNLVLNIGFDVSSTHMKKEPKYIKETEPSNNEELFKLTEREFSESDINCERDKLLIRKLYKYSLYSKCKLFWGNLFRYLGFRR